MTNYDKAIGTTYLGWADYDQINYVSMNELAAGRRPDFLNRFEFNLPLEKRFLNCFSLVINGIDSSNPRP